MRRAIWLVAAAWLATAPVLAGPCDRYDDPLAFNACLARQGPAARSVKLNPAPKSGRRTNRPAAVTRGAGRSEMVFSPRR